MNRALSIVMVFIISLSIFSTFAPKVSGDNSLTSSYILAIPAPLTRQTISTMETYPVAGITATYSEPSDSSSWPMFRGNLTHTGSSTSHAPESAALVWTYMTGGGVYSSPAVAGGMVFVGSDDHSVYALNQSTGALIWSYMTGGGVYSSPAVAGGMVFVGSDDHSVYALNQSTGALIWSYMTGGGVYSSPAVAGGMVFVGSWDHNVYALNQATGALIWNYTTRTDPVASSPAVAGGMVFIGSYDGNVYALDQATGALRWSYRTTSQVYSSPAVAGGVVFVSADDHHVYALDQATGALRWSCTIEGCLSSSPAVAGGMLFVGAWDHSVYALDQATGALRWKYVTFMNVYSSPAVAGGMVFVGQTDNAWDIGYVWDKTYALNQSTGALIWSYTTGSYVLEPPAPFHEPPASFVYSSPAVAGGMVFVGSWDHKVYALNQSTGALIWSYMTGGNVSSSPAVAGGMVFVGSDDHKVYAFGSHNVAVTSVEVPSPVRAGDPVTIGVTVLNKGHFTETFSVDVSYDDTLIGTQTVNNLDLEGSRNLTFTWDTIGVAAGSHLVSASARPVASETETDDNTATSSITIQDFAVQVDSSMKTANPCSQTNFTIEVLSTDQFRFPVTLTASGSSDLGMVFSPNPVMPSGGYAQSTLSIGVFSTSIGPRSIHVVATSGNIVHTKDVTLNVPFVSVPYYYQMPDTGWCVPTSVAMAMRYYGLLVQPWDVANALGLGHSGIGLGSVFTTYVFNYLKESGLSAEMPETVTVESIKSELDSSKLVILSLGLPINHAILITGYRTNLDDTILYVNDPSGYMMDVLYPGRYSFPYTQDEVSWRDLLRACAPVTQKWMVAVGSTAKPPYGTLVLQGGGDYLDTSEHSISATHDGSLFGSDLYIWESGFVLVPPLSGDTPGLTWRDSPFHPRQLDPEDSLKIQPFIVNPTDTDRNYQFEVTFTKDGVQKWTSQRTPVTVAAHSSTFPSISFQKISVSKILDEYGEYMITLWLFGSDGSLCDKIELPSIQYTVLSYTSISLIEIHGKLYLHVYDEQGRHVGVDYATNTTEVGIPGASYHDFGNGTSIVLLPSSVKNFTYMVDARYAHLAVENYTVNFVNTENGVTVSTATRTETIRQGEKQTVAAYYLTVRSDYGKPKGEGWYMENGTATVTIDSIEDLGNLTKKVFTDWTGAANTTSPSVTVTMNSSKTLEAQWKTQYYLSVNAQGGVVDTGSQWVDAGSTVTVTASTTCNEVTSRSRSVFTQWIGDVTSTSPSVTTKMDSPKTLTAAWKTQYYLTVKSDYGDPKGEAWYDAGSTATFSVTTPVGVVVQQVFAGWRGNSTAKTNIASITMDTPATVIADWKTDYTQLLAIAVAVVILVGSVAFLLRRRRPSAR